MNPSRRRLTGAALALAAIAALGACASDPAKSQSAGEWASDAALTAKVKSAIATDVGARTASVVNVETYNGTVQLTGFVDSQDEKNRAGDAAKKVEGVRSVKNDIRIKSAS